MSASTFDAGPRRDVVDDDRQVALVGDRAEVRLEHPAVGPVVVRRDDERGVGPELGRATGRADRGGGVVGAGAGDDPDAVARGSLAGDLDGRGDQPLALVGGQGGGLAGRAARHEAVDAGQDLPADETAEGGLVEGAVGGERGDERGERAAQARAAGGGRLRGGGRTARAGGVAVVVWDIGRLLQAAMGRRAMSSSTTRSKGWRPGGRGPRSQPVGGGQDPGGVGRPVAGRQAQLDGLAGGIEADEVHPGRRAGPDRDDLELVGGRRAAGAGRDPPGEVDGGPGRPVALGASMPLEQVRVERVERPEQLDRGLHEPAEQHHAEAEVGGRDGRRARTAGAGRRPGARSASQPVVAMTRRRAPAPRAASRLATTASGRDASIDEVGAGRDPSGS